MRRATILKNILPSTLRSEMILNCSMVLELSSFGIQTPSACFHCCANFPLLQMTLRIVHSRFKSLEHLL